MSVRISAVLAIVVGLALPLHAQDVDQPVDPNLPPPVSLTYVDGEVQALTAGATERASAPSMLVDGDGIRTSRGRAELVFGDGSVLHADDHTAIDLLGERRLRLLAGHIVFRASAAAADGYVLDTPAASLRVDARGEYNVQVDDSERGLTVSVSRGSATIEQPSERLLVRAGEEVRLDGPGARPVIRAFNSARLDAFEHWSLARYEGETLSASSRRLPSELRAYGQTFDRYGRWDHVAPYGQVWYPSVAAAWRPYYNGGWRHTRYGWTWFGSDPWAWPTHHYGRWQYASGAWFWVPARVWGPAWVTWAFAPGYVSWAPLGWNSRPVIPFYLRAGHVHPDRWRAWTVLPRGHLGRRGPIHPWIVDGRRLPHAVDVAFVERAVPRSRPPVYAAPRDYAVPRAGVRSAGGADRAVPRSGPSRTFEQEWGGMARPRSGARTGSVRAPRNERPDPAPRYEAPPPPRYQRPAPAPRYERPAPRPSAPRAERAQPRGDAGRSGATARPRGDNGRGDGAAAGSGNSGGGGGRRKGNVRRPPGSPES